MNWILSEWDTLGLALFAILALHFLSRIFDTVGRMSETLARIEKQLEAASRLDGIARGHLENNQSELKKIANAVERLSTLASQSARLVRP